MYEEIKIKIVNLLASDGGGLSLDALNISKKTNTSLQDICGALVELEKDLRVRVNKKGRYTLNEYTFGRISIISSGAGFVRCLNGNDMYVKRENLKGAIEGDSVAAELTDNDKNEGKVLKVLVHEKDYEVGQVVSIGDKKYVKLDDRKKQNFLLLPEYGSTNLLPGHKVTIKIGEKLETNIYSGQVIKIIGHINDPGIDILSKAAEFYIDTEFPIEVIEEVSRLPLEVRRSDLEGRRDLRDQTIFTIDGKDSKDFDDAVSIKALDNGHYLLGVHIADVAYYVKEFSEIDKEAYRRGTSCYLADKVIPMLPYELSNGICSLNESVDRLTKSCVMEFDRNGNLVNYDIFNSVINSKKRMTYEKVNDCLENINTDPSYSQFIEPLKTMKELSDILRRKRERNGSTDFNAPEMKSIVNEFGVAIDILKEMRMDSMKIIEDFMIAANETVATHISYMEMPFIYRIHGQPDKEKLEEFIRFIKLMDERLVKFPKNINSKAISQLLNSLKGSPNFEAYSNLLLRCMQKAIYDVNNIGHFGLALDNYTRFTSPIREYPDLLVHRTIDQYCMGDFYCGDEEIQERLKYLTVAARHASVKEQNADKCERAVNRMKAAEYMESRVGETFNGKITTVTEFGFYVDIYNGVEGLVSLGDLNYGFFDKESYTIYSRDARYRMGDLVEVTLDGTSKEDGFINLSLGKKLNGDKRLGKAIAGRNN